MKREQKASKKEAKRNVVPSATFEDEAPKKRVDTSDTNDTVFVKMMDSLSQVAGLSGTIKSENNVADIFEDKVDNWTVVLPTNILTCVDLKFKNDDVKKLMGFDLPKGLVNQVNFVSAASIRATINKNKLAELPDTDETTVVGNNKFSSGLIDKCQRDLLSKLNLNKFPKSLTELAAKDGEFKVAPQNKLLIDLDSRKFVVNRILPTIIKEEKLKGYPLANIQMSNIKVDGDYLYFRLTFKSNTVVDIITISKANFVHVNFTLPHSEFAELAKNYLDVAAPGARVEFVNHASVTAGLKGAEVELVKKATRTNTSDVTTLPVINIENAKSLYDSIATGKKYKNPIFNICNADSDRKVTVFSTKNIQSKLATVLDDEVLQYTAGGNTVVLPNTKKLILASVFDGELHSGLRVSFRTSNEDIGFAISV